MGSAARGPSPLFRLEPADGAQTVMVFSWNVAAQREMDSDAVSEVLSGVDCDLFVCGIQEGVSDDLVGTLDAVLRNADLARVELDPRTDRVVGRGDGAFVRPKHTRIAAWMRPRVRSLNSVRSCSVSTGVMQGSKGGAAVAVENASGRLCFISCHLSSKTADDRAVDYRTIVDGAGAALCPGEQLLQHFDSVVMFGDLNYRIANKGKQGDLKIDQCFECLQHDVDRLWEYDQLRREITAGRTFQSFREPVPSALYPTYKKRIVAKATDRQVEGWQEREYHTRHQQPWYKGGSMQWRMPSFTDRVLVHNHAGPRRAALLPKLTADGRKHQYYSLDALVGSDHTPVLAVFDYRGRGPAPSSPTRYKQPVPLAGSPANFRLQRPEPVRGSALRAPAGTPPPPPSWQTDLSRGPTTFRPGAPTSPVVVTVCKPGAQWQQPRGQRIRALLPAPDSSPLSLSPVDSRLGLPQSA